MKTLNLVFAILSIVSVSAIAPNCDPANCKLPNCRCSSTDIPGGLDAKNVPQMILLTFDDAVTSHLYSNFYERLLPRQNPNGCPIGITFFASHEYCDYTIVRDLYERGHEIAIHSISHKADIGYWKNGDTKTWTDEMMGMRLITEQFTGIPRVALKGIRTPFLQLGGNTQFEMMQKHRFEWDCSMPTQNQVDPGLWPYSLKYLTTQECQIPPCPDESYPDVWAVPMIDLFDKKGTPCAMLDTCIVTYKNETFDMLMENFKMHYDGNRSPFGLYVHAAWFLQDVDEQIGHWGGYIQFIDEILRTHKDVYFVTVSQALQWTKFPVALSNINTFDAWKTQCPGKTPTIAKKCNKKTCKLTKKDASSGGERWMTACFSSGTCPNCYPWIGNPSGNNC